MPLAHSNPPDNGEDLLHRLWIYTNYDCNLSCSYCAAESFVGNPFQRRRVASQTKPMQACHPERERRISARTEILRSRSG